MELLTHFLSGARKLGTRWYTKWLGMALSLGKRMEKVSANDKQYFLPGSTRGPLNEIEWHLTPALRLFFLLFRAAALSTPSPTLLLPLFVPLLPFRSCFSRLYPVFVLPTVLVACSSFFSSFSSFFLPLADKSYDCQRENRNRGSSESSEEWPRNTAR